MMMKSMMVRISQVLRRFLAVLVPVLVLASCASTYDDWSGPVDPVSRGSDNFAADSAIGARLSRGDRSALALAFTAAMSDRSTRPTAWSGSSGSGQVSAGDFLVANVLPDPDELLPINPDVALSFKLETEQGDHVLLKNSNIRLGPSTDSKIAETLPSGTGVEGIGLVQNEPWMMIAYQDRVRGYVSTTLLEKAPGAERLELAGGPLRQPYLCREFTQSLDLSGQKDRWQGMACDFGRGWELARSSGPTLLGDGF